MSKNIYRDVTIMVPAGAMVKRWLKSGVERKVRVNDNITVVAEKTNLGDYRYRCFGSVYFAGPETVKVLHRYSLDEDRCVCGGEWCWLDSAKRYGCFEDMT